MVLAKFYEVPQPIALLIYAAVVALAIWWIGTLIRKKM